MKRYLPIIILLFTLCAMLTFHLFLLVNLRFTAWPEMLSYAYLKNNGFLLYKDMIHPYPPVLTLVLSYLYKFFGYHINVLKVFSWTVIISSSVCVWLLAKEITGKHIAALSSLAFYVLTQPFLEGNMLWFDIAIVPPLLLGALFLIRGNLLICGLLLSLAGFTKQTGGLFYLAVLAFLFLRRPLSDLNTKSTKRGRLSELSAFLVGPVIFGVPLLVGLIQEDAVQGFWNWVVYYPSAYWSKFPGYVQMVPSARSIIVIGLLLTPVLWLLVKNQILQNRKWQVLILFLVLSLLSIYPRFSFFHLQSVLAFAAIAYGFFISSASKKLQIISVGLIGLIYLAIWPYIKLEWNTETRFYGQKDITLAQDISTIAADENKVFLQGLHSGLYVMANKLPPKPWGDNFGWYFEVPGIQEETLARWEKNPPDVVVWRNPSPGNWHDLGTYQPKKIVNWIEQNYSKESQLRPGIWVWRKKLVVSGVEL